VLVLHGAGTLANVVAGREARCAGMAYVVVPHGVFHPRVLKRRRRRKQLWNFALERRHLEHALAAHIFFPEEKDGLSSLGIDLPLIIAPTGFQPPDGVAWQGEGGYLLWLGRFDIETKGLDLLLEAMCSLEPEERPELRLHGPEWRGGKRGLQWQIERLELARWVTIGAPTYGHEKWNLLRRAAGFVYPSRWDACPVSVLEAVSIGLPTMTTPYPLGRFLAERGAVVLAEETPDGIAAGIRSLRAPDAAEAGRRGAETVRDDLSWRRLAATWLDRVEDLLAQAAWRRP
jgi:glycosyltransferase involved in cell wall biosynthesis